MNASIERTNKNEVKIRVNVEDEIFQNAILKSYKKNASSFNIQGFRKGKAPLNLIKKMYGESVFYDDAAQICVDDTFQEVIKENSIKPVDNPKIELISVGDGKGLEYNALVTVQPEVILGQYKDLKLEPIKYPVKDEEIDKEIDNMVEKNIILESKGSDSELEQKDVAIIDYKAYINNIPINGEEGKDYSLEIGSKTFVDGFEEQLIGMKIGETKDVFVTFPKNYKKEELDGRQVKFVVTLNDIKIKIFPDLDDEFAKDVSEFDTLEELKQSIRKKLENENSKRERRETEDKILEEVLNNSIIDVPEIMINREIDSMVNDLESSLKQQGLNLSRYLVYTGITQEKMRNNMRESAINKIKLSLILDKISEVENIVALEDEISEKASEIAKTYSPNDTQKYASSLLKSQRESIISNVKRSKAMDLLMKENNPLN
ncbi:MAG: trigger factor [Oscillospiraceae bacterium]|nr:trigger factor [Oscillospiraceae bacterium]